MIVKQKKVRKRSSTIDTQLSTMVLIIAQHTGFFLIIVYINFFFMVLVFFSGFYSTDIMNRGD